MSLICQALQCLLTQSSARWHCLLTHLTASKQEPESSHTWPWAFMVPFRAGCIEASGSHGLTFHLLPGPKSVVPTWWCDQEDSRTQRALCSSFEGQ